jgi:hypothetical protein
VWADKLYDTADFVAGCRERGCTRMSRRTTPSPPLGDRNVRRQYRAQQQLFRLYAI